jgi:ComF family protein
LGQQVCGKCGNPSSPGEPCQYCLAIEYNFDKAVSIFLYEEPLRDAILDFKYHRQSRKGKVLTSLLADWFAASPLIAEGFDLIIPIPITPRKRRRRSYNQSEILAGGIEAISGIPCAPFVLMKKSETPSQTGFDFMGRAKNVEGSFAVTDRLVVEGKRVLLVDDIITTGATVSECAKALKDAGARKVVALSLARNVLQ